MVISCVGLIACGLSNSESAPTALTPPPLEAGSLTIPMPVRQINSFKLLSLPTTVAGQTAELLLDTGSAGVRILESAAGTVGLVKTQQPSRVEFADDTVFEGVIGQAPVSLGLATSAGAINIQVIERVGCRPGRTCSEAIFDGSGVFSGIIGTSLADRSGEPVIFSPVAQLMGNFSSGYIIQTGGFSSAQGLFTVGLTPQNRSTFATLQLERIPATFTNGKPIWDDDSPVINYTIENTPIQNAPDFTAFDTGSSDIALNVTRLGSTPLTVSQLPSGSEFRAFLPGGFDYRIVVGSPQPTPGQDRIFVNSSLDFQLIGMPFFFEADTLFDINQGQIGFRGRTS